MQRYRKIEKAVGGGVELCGNGAYGVSASQFLSLQV